MTFKMKATATAAALIIGGSAIAATPIQNVDVDVDLDAVQNATAAAYWTDVADDLENEIVSRLTSQIDNDGASLSIDIDEVSLANTFEKTFGWEENFLIGDVLISNPLDASAHEFYTLKVSFENAKSYLPEDMDLATVTNDSPYYYESMIEAFADNVVAKLK